MWISSSSQPMPLFQATGKFHQRQMQLRQLWLNWWWVVLSVPHDNKGDLSLTPQVWVDAFFSPYLWIALPHVRESKTFLYSGFHAADSRYWIPVFDSGTWILDSNRYWDSGLLELLCGFHKQNFPGSQIPQAKYFPDSEISNPLHWAKLLLSAPFLAETFWLNVVHCGQVRTHRRTCLWNKSPETKIQYLLSCLPICITWVLWRFNSELQLYTSAKKEGKKEKKLRDSLGGGGGGVRISRIVWDSKPVVTRTMYWRRSHLSLYLHFSLSLSQF